MFGGRSQRHLGSLLQAATMARALARRRCCLIEAALVGLHLFSLVRVSDSASGCVDHSDCNGHGTCDTNSKTCTCVDGFGSANDVCLYKSPACATRCCPSSKSWADVPTAANTAHAQAECSDGGLCNRGTGLCVCFTNYEGPACERRK